MCVNYKRRPQSSTCIISDQYTTYRVSYGVLGQQTAAYCTPIIADIKHSFGFIPEPQTNLIKITLVFKTHFKYNTATPASP